MPTPATIESEQSLQVNVDGPADIRKLHLVSGIARCTLIGSAPPGPNFREVVGTFVAQVGPALTAAQFRRAAASVAITALSTRGEGLASTWNIIGVDADFDDESGRVELQFDLKISVNSTPTTGVDAILLGVGFQVQILST